MFSRSRPGSRRPPDSPVPAAGFRQPGDASLVLVRLHLAATRPAQIPVPKIIHRLPIPWFLVFLFMASSPSNWANSRRTDAVDSTAGGTGSAGGMLAHPIAGAGSTATGSIARGGWFGGRSGTGPPHRWHRIDFRRTFGDWRHGADSRGGIGARFTFSSARPPVARPGSDRD